MWLLNDLFAASAAHTAERMSVMALDRLHEFRARAQATLQVNRKLLDEFLDRRSDLECVLLLPERSLPRLMRGDAENFFQPLRDKYETTVVPGRFFEMPQHFRIGIGGETSELRGGLERMNAALDEFARVCR